MTLRDRLKKQEEFGTDLLGAYADSTGRMEAREKYRILQIATRGVSASEESAERWATQRFCGALSSRTFGRSGGPRSVTFSARSQEGCRAIGRSRKSRAYRAVERWPGTVWRGRPCGSSSWCRPHRWRRNRSRRHVRRPYP